jgi:hypothetical protein
VSLISRSLVLILIILVLPVKAFTGFQSYTIQAQQNKTAVVYNAWSLSKTTRLLLSSFQGLYNRKASKLFVFGYDANHHSDWIGKEVYKITTNPNQFDSLYSEAQIFSYIRNNYHDAAIKGAVVYSVDEAWQVNLATNISALKNLVMVPDYTTARKLGLAVKFDINRHFQSMLSKPSSYKLYKSYIWLLQNNWLDFDKSMIAVYSADDMFDLERDIAIMKKHLVIPFPGTAQEKSLCTSARTNNDDDYSSSYRNLIYFVLQHFPANIPAIGWYQVSQKDRPDFYGVCEKTGVKIFGEYGKFTWGSSFTKNLSFHINKKTITTLKQKAIKRNLKFNPAAKYVAFTMMESGDSVGYHQWGFYGYQWSDKARGSVPVSYGITPALKDLMPAVAQHLYSTASSSDYFFSSIGGLGYSYVLDGYGSKGTRVFEGVSSYNGLNKDQILDQYFRKTGQYLNAMDIDSFGLYSVSYDQNWMNSYNNFISSKILKNIPFLKSIVSDMGRLSNIYGHNSVSIINNVPVFHSLTRWYIPPYDMTTNLLPNNPNKYEREAWDNALANWLAHEIRSYSHGTNFINAMAYSWHYGPRRLELVKNILEKEGYVFVTIEELADLQKQAS